MRVKIGPTSGRVLELLASAGSAVAEVTRAVEQRFARWPAGPSQEEVKELEHLADEIVSNLLHDIDAQFVTPYDRDDLVVLAFAVDDVADAADNAAELLGLYGVETPTRQSLELCALLVRAAEQLAELLAGIKRKDEAHERIQAIKALEDEADDVARAARASLFKDDRIDPMIVIRWKDIYEALEHAIDACDTAANRVGNILVKNA